MGLAARPEPAAPATGRPASHRLPGALLGTERSRQLRGAIGCRGAVGAAPLRRRMARGGQPPQERPTRPLPAAQARAGPGQVLSRHVPAGRPQGQATGQTGLSCAVGAAGPPDPLPGRTGAGGHPAARRRAAVAGGHRRRPRQAARPGPSPGGGGGPWHHPPVCGGDRGRRATGLRAGDPRRELPTPARPAGPPGQGSPPGASRGSAARAAGAGIAPTCAGSRPATAVVSTRRITTPPNR